LYCVAAIWCKLGRDLQSKMCPNEIKQMELERSMFLGRSGGRDDIDRFLLDEGYSPMPTYDSDGHFRDDEDADAEDDEGDADIDSYNW